MRNVSQKSWWLIVCAALIFAFCAYSVTSGATIFSDDFEDGNSTGWSTSGGSWSVVTDGTKVYKQSSTSATAYSYSGTASWTNYSAQARVKALSFNGTARPFGITARYQSTSNYYYLTLSNANQLQLGKKASSGSAVLASKTLTVQTGTWYTLKLAVNGTQLEAYVDGVLQLSATDSALATGKVGCYAAYVSAEFDDLLVDGAASNPTATPTATATVKPSASVTPTPTATATVKPSTSPTATATPTPTSTTYPTTALYVAPNGTDNNPGTVDFPTTLTAALLRIQPGGTIYMRGGTYPYATEIQIALGNSGTPNQMKNLFAYGSEVPVLDFSSQPFISNEENPRGIKLAGDYWHIKGIEIMGAADNGLYVCGDHNIIELCHFHHNRDSGLQISRYDNHTQRSDWPSYNLILNCTSHDNHDPDEEDADGFACKLTSGDGNVFRGCIAYHNSDDGWDLYTKPATGPIGEVLIEDCVAYENGYLTSGTGMVATSGDGNGFKLGGSSMPVNHTIRRSIAFRNRVKGLHYNSNSGSILVENCTSWDNKTGGNFVFSVGTHVFRNNLSYYNPTKRDEPTGTDVDSSNCWWIGNQSVNGKGLVVSDADFISLTPTISRNADGSINLGNFLKLAPGSDLIGAGTPSGNIGAR